jgi:undecaprenyl-diphosphatase
VEMLISVILGVIEGLTEFLPVSSTGHMVIAMPLLGVKASEPPWNVLLWVSQFGAILAVIVYFWRDLWRRTFQPPSRDWQQHIMTKLFVAMVPTGVLALAFKGFLDPLEEMPVAVAIALILGAGAIEFIDRRYRKTGEQTLEDVTLWQAFWIGAIQTISMVPGVSRSGASIMGGMTLGLTPRVAAEFSFYLAIPTMLAAGAKTTLDHWEDMTRENALVVLVGTAVSFVVALLVVAAFMGFVKRYRFTVFAVYRVILGVAVLILYAQGWFAIEPRINP